MTKLSCVLMITPIDISSRILGPSANETEVARALSTCYRTYLIIGISPRHFLLRSAFLSKLFRQHPSNLRVVLLPFLNVRYLVILSKLVFAFLSMFIVVFLHMTNKVATIVVRDNCIPVIMSLPLRLLGIPFIYRAISTPFASLEIGVLEFRGPIDKIHRVLTRIFDMVALSRASKILTSSPDAENLILSKLSVPKDRIALVPYSIPDFFFEQEKCTQEELLRRTAEKMTLTYFGSLNEIYSFENLLGAMRVLKNDGYDLRLTIYGDGPNKRHIISRVAELDLQGDVIINDTVSRARVPDLYRFATAAVVPYSGKLERGVSLKSIEAMALRVPVIISKQSDALYVNGKNCIVLGSDSVDAWVISIKKVTNSYVRQELIKGGIETAKIFRRPVVTELLRQTVDSVVSGKIAGDGKDIPR